MKEDQKILEENPNMKNKNVYKMKIQVDLNYITFHDEKSVMKTKGKQRE